MYQLVARVVSGTVLCMGWQFNFWFRWKQQKAKPGRRYIAQILGSKALALKGFSYFQSSREDVVEIKIVRLALRTVTIQTLTQTNVQCLGCARETIGPQLYQRQFRPIKSISLMFVLKEAGNRRKDPCYD
jgi:hypothetical protein